MNHFLMGKCPLSEKPYIPVYLLKIYQCKGFRSILILSILIHCKFPFFPLLISLQFIHQEATKFDEAFQWICHLFIELNQMRDFAICLLCGLSRIDICINETIEMQIFFHRLKRKKYIFRILFLFK